ncbi:hypothetical protein MKD33_06790, partial [Chromobacterium piscinae]
GDSSQID